MPFLYIIDDVEKWDDIKELMKSNPNLGVSVQPDFYQEEIAVAKGSLSKKIEFLTKYCNIKQNSSVAWLDYNVVDKAAVDYTLEDFRNCYGVGGIDLSQTTDLTAATALIQKKASCMRLHNFLCQQSEWKHYKQWTAYLMEFM